MKKDVQNKDDLIIKEMCEFCHDSGIIQEGEFDAIWEKRCFCR